MAKEMLINVSEGEECRIALVEDGKLEELYMERTSSTSHVGNIYKGRVTNVEPSIQAAFIDFGLGRNGFLHISDLMPTYFGRAGEDIHESVGRKMARKDRPPIQRCLRRGDDIIVQIIKEGIGTKGPTLSTYLSIPGKILVMMPGMGKMGVSKKIEDETERKRLRTILDSLKPPKDVAFIIRTAGIGKTKAEIQRDLKYLTRLWEQITKKQKEPAPVELYTEGDLVTRTVRDVFTSDVDRIVIDSKDVAKRIKDVIKITAPRTKNRVDVYEGHVPLFHEFGVERDIESMYSRHVPLPSGGSLVIDQTEAIVAIDVNSGKFRDHSDAEMTAFKTDMEAADEICRQLKLRDLGGVIICDFIDLRYERHRRELEHRLNENLKRDRAKTKVLRMSQFGIVEMTRQRMRPSLKRSVYFDCPNCKGAGLVKTPESMALDVMRKLAIAAHHEKVHRVEMTVCGDVAMYLNNKKRRALADLESESKKRILVRIDQTLGLDEVRLELFDSRDGAVILEELGMTYPTIGHTTQLGRPAHHQQRHGSGHQHGGRRDRDRGGRDRHQQRPPSQPARAMEFDDDEEDQVDTREALDSDEGEDTRTDSGGRGDNRGRLEDRRENARDNRRDGRNDRRPINRDRAELDEREPAVLDTEAASEAAEPEEQGGGEEVARGGADEGDGNGGPRRRRRRRGRRGRGGGSGEQQAKGSPPQPLPTARTNDGRRRDGSFENQTEFDQIDFGDGEDEQDRERQPAEDAAEPEVMREDAGVPEPGNEREPKEKPVSRRKRGTRGGRRKSQAKFTGGRTQQVAPATPNDRPSTPVEGNVDEMVNTGAVPKLPTAGDATEGGQGAEGEGGSTTGNGRRRRRRGGRRHRRRRDRDPNEAVGQGGAAPSSGEAVADDEEASDHTDELEGDNGAAGIPSQDPQSSISNKSEVRRPSPPPPEIPIVRTGSSDKHHLKDADVDALDEEPHVPAPRPARRPSFRDLDAIPDDFD